MRATSLGFLLATALALGCSSSGDDAPQTDADNADVGDALSDAHDTKPPPSDVGVDTGPGDVGLDAGCNSTSNVALQVTENNVAADLPTGIGGLIADGIYVVSALTKYNGPGGKVGPGTYQVVETIAVSGGGTKIAGVRQVGTDLGFGYNANIAPSGGSLTWKQTCPTIEVSTTYDYSIGSSGAETIELYDKIQKIGTTYTRKFLTP